MVTLAYIRNSIDTQDEFYDKEMEFIQENEPKVKEAEISYIKEFVNSKFRKELEEKYAEYFVSKI